MSNKRWLSCLCLFTWFEFAIESPPSSVEEVSSPSDLHLIEGDIALPPHHHGTALHAFLRRKLSLWPHGRIPYRIDEEDYDYGFGIEPVFLDSQILNITIALQKIEAGVPCIKFM